MALVLAVTGYLAGLLAREHVRRRLAAAAHRARDRVTRVGARLRHCFSICSGRQRPFFRTLFTLVLPAAVYNTALALLVYPWLGALLAPRTSDDGVPPTGLTHRRAGRTSMRRERRARLEVRYGCRRSARASSPDSPCSAAVIVVVLGVLLVRLWTMQVLYGPGVRGPGRGEPHPRRHAPSAPRGRILDRAGRELVTNRPTMAVLVKPQVRDDEQLLTRLSSVLNMPRD